jgi:hypothetical protein
MCFANFQFLTMSETVYLHQIHDLTKAETKLRTALRPDGDFTHDRYALKSISASQFFLIEHLVGAIAPNRTNIISGAGH